MSGTLSNRLWDWDMSGQTGCARCQKDLVVQVWPRTPRELVAAVIGMVPFQCRHCRYRFLDRRVRRASTGQPFERREHLRIPVRLCLSFSGGKVRGEGTVLDISLGGCVIQSQTHVRVDDIFYLEIGLAEGEAPVEVAAMVRSVSARGIAFKFLRQAQENKQLLTFIQSHSGSTSSVLTKSGQPTVTG